MGKIWEQARKAKGKGKWWFNLDEWNDQTAAHLERNSNARVAQED